MNKISTNAQQRVIKHAGFSGFATARPASWFVTADSDEARNPARFFVPLSLASPARGRRDTRNAQ